MAYISKLIFFHNDVIKTIVYWEANIKYEEGTQTFRAAYNEASKEDKEILNDSLLLHLEKDSPGDVPHNICSIAIPKEYQQYVIKSIIDNGRLPKGMRPENFIKILPEISEELRKRASNVERLIDGIAKSFYPKATGDRKIFIKFCQTYLSKNLSAKLQRHLNPLLMIGGSYDRRSKNRGCNYKTTRL